MPRRLLLIPVLLLANGWALTQNKPAKGSAKRGKPAKGSVEDAAGSIIAQRIGTYLHRLCYEFQGRKSASPGERAAAEWIASEFRANGLKPAGEGGNWFQQFPCNTRLAKGTGTNVLGLLEGSDAKLKEEILAIGGHIDAVGGVGADDDASGSSAVLMLSYAFGKVLKTKPKRSILFCGWGSEEVWMVGSYHWAEHATVDRNRIKFYFNLDMIGRNDRAEKQVYFAGWDSANPPLRDRIQNHAGKAEIKVLYEDSMISPPGDAMPFYEKIKVPFLYLYTYGYGEVHADYHQPSDTPDKCDLASMEKIVRLSFHVILDLANGDALPAHVPGYRFPHPAQGKPRK